MDRDVLLKKNIIGGFDRKQVLDYISQLQSNCNNRKAREEIEDMRLRVASLREIIRDKDKQIAALTTEIDEINSINLSSSEKNVDFDLLRRSNEQIDSARNEAEEITAKVSEGIKNNDDKIANLLNRISSINEEINRFGESIGAVSDKLDNVPFEPVTENDVESFEMPKFNFDKVIEAIAEEEAQLVAEAEARVIAEHEERIRIESEIRAKLEAEAEEKARIEAEEKAKAEAEEKARIEAEEKAKAEAEEKARIEAEEKAKAEAEEKARIEAEERAKIEAENNAKTAVQEEKINTLFAKLTAMTDEINKMNASLSDVSERLNQMPANQVNQNVAEAANDSDEAASDTTEGIESENDDELFESIFDEIENAINPLPVDNDSAQSEECESENCDEPEQEDIIDTSDETETAIEPSDEIEIKIPVEFEAVEESDSEVIIDEEKVEETSSEEFPTQTEILAENEKKIEEIRAEKEKLEKIIAEKETTPKETTEADSKVSDYIVEEELYFTLEI